MAVNADQHARQERRSSWKNASWSDCVVDASRDHKVGSGGLGLRFRGAVAGPEQVLVEAFLEAARTRLGPGRSLTVFAQPAIETGFPDLVAVVWRSDIARGWVSARDQLRAIDLRLLHLLATMGAIDLAFLREVFQRGLQGMMSRLEEACVISVGRTKCRACKPSSIFAVERIIAVEAKVCATQRVLEQAGGNTWFSSESHALIPKPRADVRLKDAAAALGVGVIGLEQDEVAQLYDATVRSVPLSYGSWLFNEWTWRVAREQGAL